MDLYLYIAVIDTDKNGNYFVFKIIKDKVVKFYQHINTHYIHIEKTASGKSHIIQNFEELKMNKIIGYPPYLYIISDNVKFKKEIINIFNEYINHKNNKYYRIGEEIAKNACKEAIDELSRNNEWL